MKKVSDRSSIVTVLKKLGSRAALLLLAYLMMRPGKKKAAALMIKEATLGGHRIKYEMRMSRTANEEGEFEVEEQGHTVYITPTAWIDRRNNLIAHSVVTEYDDRLLFADDKRKRGRGPRPFMIDGRPVLAITADLTDLKTKEIVSGIDVVNGEDKPWSFIARPIVRSYLLPSAPSLSGTEWVTFDHRTREGAAFFSKMIADRWDLSAWVHEKGVPCALSDRELDELQFLDLVYRVCVDLGLQKEKTMSWADAGLQKVASVEQERTKGGEAEFSGRPDDGHEGFVGGGISWANTMVAYRPGGDMVDPKTGEHLATSIIPVDEFGHDLESPAWSMESDYITLNGLVVPPRPDKAAFMKDLAWGWNCRLDLTKQMVKVKREDGEYIWLDTREQAFKDLPKFMTDRLARIPVLKVEPVRVEETKSGRCTVRTVKGRPKGIEPMGIIRRHLHNLIQLGYASYFLKPYVCPSCSGTGMAPANDPETGEWLMGQDNKPVLFPCTRCGGNLELSRPGSGAGAPGYHMDYRTGLCTPNHVGARVMKSEKFACKGKKAKCGNRVFITDIHAEVCAECGAELWKNSLIMLVSSANTSEAYDLPEEATHSAVQVYGQLVKDMIRARVNRVNQFAIEGKPTPPTIGTSVVMRNGVLAPNTLESLGDMSTPPKLHKVRGSLATVISILMLKPKIAGWDVMVRLLANAPVHRPKAKSYLGHTYKYEELPWCDALFVQKRTYTPKAHDAEYKEWIKKAIALRAQARKEMGK